MAYVTFASAESALSALRAMDRCAFQGRILHAIPAVSRRGKPDELVSDGKKASLKESRLQKSKDVAGKDFNWAMLYMNVRGSSLFDAFSGRGASFLRWLVHLFPSS